MSLTAPPATSGAEVLRTGGVLGASLTYELSAGPLDIYGIAYSFNSGPTPLSFFDPTDARVLDVGIDLVSLWKLGFLDTSGKATLVYPLPLQTSLHGLPFHAQMITLPGESTLIDLISEPNVFVLGLAQESTLAADTLPIQLELPTQTPLPDGRILHAGGIDTNPVFAAYAVNVYHMFDPQTGAFEVLGPPMSEPCLLHTATLLDDGRVLTMGGIDENTQVRKTAEIYDPATDTVFYTSMLVPRMGHSASKLPDGRVLVVGGTSLFDYGDPFAIPSAVHDTSEIFDPVTGLWTWGPPIPKPRMFQSTCELGDGTILFVGGLDITSIAGFEVPAVTNTAIRFDPVAFQFFSAGPMPGEPRLFNSQTTLPNGDALLLGGFGGTLVPTAFHPLADGARFNPSTGNWTSVGALNTGRGFHQVIELNGTIYVMGGSTSFDLSLTSSFAATPTGSIETSDTSALVWTASFDQTYPRRRPVSALFDNGDRILTVGPGDNGTGGSVADFTAEIFIP